MPVEHPLIYGLLVVCGSAAVVAVLTQRLHFPLIPSYLLAGLCIGPYAFGIVGDVSLLKEVGNLAVVLLLFGIGLELHLPAYRKDFFRFLWGAVCSCVFSVLAGWPCALLFGLGAGESLIVVMALSLSSTAVVLKLMHSRRELRTPAGRLAVVVLLCQDVFALLLLAAVPIIAGAEQFAVSSSFWQGWGGGLARMGITLLVLGGLGRFVLPRVLEEAFRFRSVEVTLVVGVALALGIAQLASLGGFSVEMGAFTAGLLLSQTRFRHQLSGQIGPLRDLFLAVFFVSMGMKLDWRVLLESWHVLAAGILLMFCIKGAAIAGASWLFGSPLRVALYAGLGLAQAGEFTLVVAGSAFESGLVQAGSYSAILGIAIISLCLTPFLVIQGSRLAQQVIGGPMSPFWHQPAVPFEAESSIDGADQGRAVVAGYGVAGKLIVERLQAKGLKCTVVELNHQSVGSLEKSGVAALWGDIRNPQVMEAASLRKGGVVALAFPDDDNVIRACRELKVFNSELYVAVRLQHESRRQDAASAGADMIVVEEGLVAREMSRGLLRWLQERTRPAG